MTTVSYEPVPSTIPFLTSDKFISMIVGPYGSTKTTAGIYKIAYEAKRVAAGKDGIRRSRYAWIRQTKQMISDSSLPDILKAFPDGVAGTLMKSDMKFILKFDDVICEILMRGLDESTDVRRLLSTQLTGAIIEEFRECNPDIFDALTGRVGRYPDAIMVPHRPEWGLDHKGNPIQGCVDDTGKPVDKIWMMSNPPDSDSFWHHKITNPESNMHVTIQPSGLSEEADWVHLLKSDYYENMAIGKTEAWCNVYIHAKFGQSLSGKPVFRSFNRDLHVAKSPLVFNPISTNPLLIGMDTALHPAAVIGQLDHRGRLNIFHSLHAADTGALRFIREHLKPVLANRFGGARIIVVSDPAGAVRSQTDESTVLDVLRAEGFVCKPAKTNSIAARIAAVDSFLTRTVDGKPALLIDPEYNQELIQAMAGKYRYKIRQDGSSEDKPDKVRPFADLCFVAGTKVSTPDGDVCIEDIRVGDYVITPYGNRKVSAASCTGKASVTEYTMDDGRVLIATPDHPVFVDGVGVLGIDSVQYGDILLGINEKELSWAGLTKSNVCVKHARKNLKKYLVGSLMEKVNIAVKFVMALANVVKVSNMAGTGSEKILAMGIIGVGSRKDMFRCTDMCGNSTTVIWWQDTTYTTKITTKTTILQKILKLCQCMNTGVTTPESESLRETKVSLEGLNLREKRQKNGMHPKKVSNGIQNTGKKLGLLGQLWRKLVCIARRNFLLLLEQKRNVIALLVARVLHVENLVLTMNRGLVRYAKDYSRVTNIPRKKRAVRIVGKRPLPLVTSVYNIQVADANVFYAEGVLVHNCDGLQYLALHADGGATFGRQLLQPTRREIKGVSSRGWT